MTCLALSNLAWLTRWWNLIFLLPLGLALLYLGLYVATGVTFGEADADADADADMDVDTDSDVDAEGDADVVDADTDADVVDADADGDAESDSDSGAHAHAVVAETYDAEHHAEDGHHDGRGSNNPVMDVLVWIGAGRMPLSLVIMLFTLTWGLTGVNLNRLMASFGFSEWAIPLISIPMALLVAALLTRWIARLVSRFLPMSSTQARRTESLVGSVGVALSAIDSNFGLVQVRAPGGDVFQVPCRVAIDRNAIEKDQRVLLVDYDKQERFFYVIPDELGRLKQ